MVRVVLMTGPALEFVHKAEIVRFDPMPGVVVFEGRAFMFAYQENPDSFVYRETGSITLEAPCTHRYVRPVMPTDFPDYPTRNQVPALCTDCGEEVPGILFTVAVNGG